MRKDSLKSTKTTLICCVIIGILLIGLSVYAAFANAEDWRKNGDGPKTTGTKAPTPTEVVLPTRGDTEAEGLVLEVDSVRGRIKVYLPFEDRETDLYYTGTSDLRNRFGAVISGIQVDVASIVKLSYDAESGVLYSLAELEPDWAYEKQSNVVINTEKEMLTVAGNNYRCGKNVVVRESEEIIDISELAPVDELTVRGMGDRVFVIERVNGHGALRLINASAFVGGIFYIDGKEAENVTGDMKMTMREGEYRLALELEDLYAEKTVQISRDAIAVWDLTEYIPPEIHYGKVEFMLEPEDAEFYIDQELQTNKAFAVLEYGEHVVGLYKEGYIGWTGKITVASEEMLFTVSLVKEPTPTPKPTSIPTPTEVPVPTGTPTPPLSPSESETPGSTGGAEDAGTDEEQKEIQLIWYPMSVVTIDSVYAGTTDAAGILTVKLSPGKHVVELTRILLDGSTQPKTYNVDVNAQTAVLNLLMNN